MNKVTVHRHKTENGLKWVVSRRESGKRKRSFFDTKTDAEDEAERLRTQIADSGAVWLSLPAHERSRLIAAYAEAQKLGVDIHEAIKNAKANPSTGNGLTLKDAVAELILAKQTAGRSPIYTSGLKIVLNQFASSLPSIAVVRIGLTELETFLATKSLASRSTLRARLSTLFKFCIRRGYRLDNPCARLESITVEKLPPQTFTVEQTKIALKWLRVNAPKALPWFILSTCCGLRPEEAEKTRKADLHFKEGWIKIEAQTTKVRQRRIVYPKSEAMRLLQKSLKRGRLPLGHQTRRRALRSLREALKFKVWPKDITRHTAASYWIADCQSAAHVAESLGNSEKVLKRDYKALKTKEEAKTFWALIGKF